MLFVATIANAAAGNVRGNDASVFVTTQNLLASIVVDNIQLEDVESVVAAVKVLVAFALAALAKVAVKMIRPGLAVLARAFIVNAGNAAIFLTRACRTLICIMVRYCWIAFLT